MKTNDVYLVFGDERKQVATLHELRTEKDYLVAYELAVIDEWDLNGEHKTQIENLTPKFSEFYSLVRKCIDFNLDFYLWCEEGMIDMRSDTKLQEYELTFYLTEEIIETFNTTREAFECLRMLNQPRLWWNVKGIVYNKNKIESIILRKKIVSARDTRETWYSGYLDNAEIIDIEEFIKLNTVRFAVKEV
jgi:hypothetical protein